MNGFCHVCSLSLARLNDDYRLNPFCDGNDSNIMLAIMYIMLLLLLSSDNRGLIGICKRSSTLVHGYRLVHPSIPTSTRFIYREITSSVRFMAHDGLSNAISFPSASSSLSSSSSIKPIRKVAVIGAGIAGLSFIHSITNRKNGENAVGGDTSATTPDIFCYESRPFLDLNKGAGLQLNGGLSVLQRELHSSVFEAVWDAGLPCEGIRSINTEGKLLIQFNLLDIVRKAGGAVADALIRPNHRNNNDNSHDVLLWLSITRSALQEVLYNTLPKAVKGQVLFNKQLTAIEPCLSKENGTVIDSGLYCHFQDQTIEGPFDLIIGCDGARSLVRSYMDSGIVATTTNDVPSSSLYSGIRIRYAVQSQVAQSMKTTTKADPITLKQYFANGLYALHGRYGNGATAGSTSDVAYLIYLDPKYLGPFRRTVASVEEKQTVSTRSDENVDWEALQATTNASNRDLMFQQIQDAGLGRQLVETDLLRTIKEADQFFELGVYFHNPFSVHGWYKEVPSSNGAVVVLCGDAAHAFPPFLGQGANQAIQDAFCLATQILSHNNDIKSCEQNHVQDGSLPLSSYLQHYTSVRWPPTFGILLKSTLIGYLETGGPAGIYSTFRDLLFQVLVKFGIAEKVLLEAATPIYTGAPTER
jgi:salicylate hydroxylase